MEEFTVNFNSSEDKNIMQLAILLSCASSGIPFFLVLIFFNDKLSESARILNKALLNFSLIVFIAGFMLGAIPLLNVVFFLLSPLVLVIYIYFMIMAIMAISNNQPVKLPKLITIIK